MLRPLIALVAIAFLSVAAARAEVAAPSVEPSVDATPTTGVTPDEAAQALAVLQDPGKRDELVKVLQAIARASSPAVAPTSAKAPAPAAHLTLKPDSLGSELVLQAAGWAQEFSDDMLAAARAVANAPALYRGLSALAANPEAQSGALDVSWRLAITFVLALAGERLIALALRRPIAALESEGFSAATETAEPAVAPEHWRLLGRLPAALARLLLWLLPVGAFAGVGLMLTFVQVGAADTTRLIILETLKAYILCRVFLALAQALTSPRKSRLRLLSVGDQTAAYILVWARRLIMIVVVGATFAEVAELLGGNAHLRHGLVKIVSLVVNLCLISIVLQCRATVANRLRAPSGAVGARAALENRLADVWHFVAIAAIITLWFVLAVRAQDSASRALQLVVESALALALARVVAITALGALDRLLRVNNDFTARFPGLETRANRYYPALRAAISLAIVWITAIALFEIWGVDAISWFNGGAFGSLLISALVTIAVAATVAAAVWEAANAAIDRHIERLNREAHFQRAARLRTLSPILRTTLLIAILVVLGLTALSEIGVNIAPLLAGAGIVGIAIGFGSQKLVQDLITGLFLLLENAIQVGDWVTAAGLSGSVETLSIRTMRLRAGDGAVHIVPFSSVTSVTNANRGVGNAAVSVSVAYDEDTDRVGQTLTEIALEMRQEAKFKASMLSELQLWGVDKVDALGATIVGQIVCTDAGRWEVQREFNRRMKQRFQQLGIQIAPPAPTVVIAPQLLRPDALNAERAPNDPDEARDPVRQGGG